MTRRAVTLATLETERQFQARVIALAKMRGWMHYATWRSVHSPAGFPDLLLCRTPRLVALELKRTDGQPTADQQEWIEALMAAGIEARCAWPEHWGELVELLT